MDALVYSEMSNNITDQEELQNLANLLNLNSSNITEIDNQLNEYLKMTTIKRACCMGRDGPNKGDGSTGVIVRIPKPNTYNTSTDVNKSLEDRFNYIEKTVYVPSKLCDNAWKKYQPYCDNFMNVYCTNQVKLFTALNNNSFDQGNWKLYSKECSCYAPPNPSYGSAPHICYMNGCSDGDTGVYVDASSRGKQCDMTVCTSILNASGIRAGLNANIDSTVQQNCGPAISKMQEQHSVNNNPINMESNSLTSGAIPINPSLFNSPKQPTQALLPSTSSQQPSQPIQQPITSETPSSESILDKIGITQNMINNTFPSSISSSLTPNRFIIMLIVCILFICCLCCCSSLLIF
jgi:hypothetical protein